MAASTVMSLRAPVARASAAPVSGSIRSAPAHRAIGLSPAGFSLNTGRAMRIVCNSDKTKAEVASEIDALMADTEKMIEASHNEQAGDSAVESREGLELQCDDSGCAWVPSATSPGEIKQGQDASLKCDTKGCFLSEDGKAATSSSFRLMQGPGWRLGFETDPKVDEEFVALVGSDNWSLALGADEFNDFYRLLQTMRQSAAALDTEGAWESGADGLATLEVKTDRVWMQGSAPEERLTKLQKLWSKGGEKTTSCAFDLRFVITSPAQREVEGFLKAEGVMGMLEAMEAEGESFDQ